MQTGVPAVAHWPDAGSSCFLRELHGCRQPQQPAIPVLYEHVGEGRPADDLFAALQPHDRALDAANDRRVAKDVDG